MKRALIALLLVLLPVLAQAQQFPTVPDHTFIGRIGTGSGSGPSQAVPFSQLLPYLYGNQTANTVFAGPGSGAATVPSFRALVANDIPSLSTLNGTLGIGQGGTGQTTAPLAITALMPTPTRAGDLAYWNGSIWTTLPGNNSGTGVFSENASGVPSFNGGAVGDPKAGRFIPLITGTVSGVSCNASTPFNCLQFCQFRGNQILVNGVYVAIPSGGCSGATGGIMAAVTKACIENSPPTPCTPNSTLANNTTYYIYVGLVSGTPTMIFSTTAYNVYASTYGNAVMNSDPAASLIGLIHTDASNPTVSGSANQQNTASWFNPVWDGLTATITGTFSAGSYTDISSSNHVTFVQWSDNVPTLHANCVLNQNSGGALTITLGIGVSATGTTATSPSATSAITVDNGNLLRQVSIDLSGAIGSEGYVIGNILGLSNGSATITTSSCTLQVPSRIPS